jgi:hypothetical protein
MYGATGVLGEIRTHADLAATPEDVRLRVVYLDDSGPVIRWMLDGSTTAAGYVGGTIHDRLERGDGHGAARCGYLTRRSDGSVNLE